jgi:dihydroflavonol-4-reductase
MPGAVLVTGGSGYIAGFLIRQLVAQGWQVRTTLRDLAREAEVRARLAVDDARLAFVTAELLDDAGWAQAMAGCTHVAHVASPVPSRAPKNEEEVIRPAREGVLRALRFARDAGVQRFVMTSSVAAICYGRPRGTYTFTEADWTRLDVGDTSAYVKSKTIAERAARDWVAAEGGGMTFCSVNPGLVLGPVLGSDFSPSLLVVKKLLEGALPGCPDLGFAPVDVHDIADLHVRALGAPDMAGERFIGAGPFMKILEVAHVLRGGLGEQARRVPLRRLPDLLVRVSALFDPTVRQVVGELGKVRNVDASHAQSRLGWTPRPNEQAILEAARSLIAHGIARV